jgi:hypothetical protein
MAPGLCTKARELGPRFLFNERLVVILLFPHRDISRLGHAGKGCVTLTDTREKGGK